MASYPIAVGDIVQVTLVGNLNGQTLMNTVHYRSTGSSIPDGAAGLNELLTTLYAGPSWVPPIITAANQLAHFDYLQAQLIYPGRQAYVRIPLNVDGTTIQDELPQNTSLSIAKRSIVAGHGKTGRMAVWGLNVTDVLGGKLSPTGSTLWDPVAAAIPTVMVLPTSGGNFTPIIFNRTAPPTSPVITSCELQIQSRVLVRRTVGRGK